MSLSATCNTGATTAMWLGKFGGDSCQAQPLQLTVTAAATTASAQLVSAGWCTQQELEQQTNKQTNKRAMLTRVATCAYVALLVPRVRMLHCWRHLVVEALYRILDILRLEPGALVCSARAEF